MSSVASTCTNITVEDVEKLIKLHNEELPKNVQANKDELILVDNPITLKIKLSKGTIVGMLVEGRWGSGKTYSCYKIFHDLKDTTLVTYVPMRSYAKYYEKEGVLPPTKINGVSSISASAIAEALVRASTLAKNVEGVLTNAMDVQSISVEQELVEVLREYSTYLAETGKEHLVLIDEIEDGIKSPADADALSICWSALRDIRDVKGHHRITVAVFAVPLTRHQAQGIIRGERLRDYIIKKLELSPHVRTLLHYGDLDNLNITRQILRGLLERSIEVVNKKLGCAVDVNKLRDVDQAIDLILDSLALARYGKDILRQAIARAYIEALQTGSSSLLEHVKEAFAMYYGVSDKNLAVDVIVRGQISKLESLFPKKNIIEGFKENLCESVLRELQVRGRIKTYYEVGSRTESGFLSTTYNIIMEKSGKKGLETHTLKLTFWLRTSPINKKTLSKVDKYYGDSKIVLIYAENVKHEVIPSNVIYALSLPNPILYYALSGKAVSVDLAASLEEILKDYISKLREGLLSVLE